MRCICTNIQSKGDNLESIRLESLESQNYCAPCADDQNNKCGGFKGVHGYWTELVSAYYLNETQFEYEYYQCIKRPAFNEPKLVYNQNGANASYFYNQTDDGPSCLRQCKSMGFEMVILTMRSTSIFLCECVNHYKIRMQDISDNCLRWWCPSIQGDYK